MKIATLPACTAVGRPTVRGITMNNDFDISMRAALDATVHGQLDAAEQHLQQAMRQQPGDALPHYLLGANCAQQGRTDVAEGAYIACLSRAPGFAIARFQLGLLQLTNGRSAAAHATWEPLLQAEGDDALQCFARGLLEIGGGNTGLGREQLLRGIALNTGNPPLNHDMRGVLARLDRTEAGTRAVQRAVDPAAAPDSPSDAAATGEHYLISSYRQG
jgi:tetratricopeptide (TPR) repeat protein